MGSKAPSTRRWADVAIVGGGVASLTLAAQLIRADPDLQVEVLERALPTDSTTRGVLIHPGTQVLLERLNLQVDAADVAGPVERFQEYRHDDLIAEVDARYVRLGSERQYVPRNVRLSEMTAMLTASLQQLPQCHIRYGVVMGEATRTGEGWRLDLHGADGAGQAAGQLVCSLLVGADGTSSRLRELGDFNPRVHPFPGRVDVIAVADRRAARPAISMVVQDHECTTVVDNGVGPLTLLFDMRPDGHSPATPEQLRPDIIERAGIAGLTLREDTRAAFATSLRSSIVSCDRWYDDQLLLLGDAAHAMHNLGGQGFNLAVQNAMALARPVEQLLRSGSAEALQQFERLRLPYVADLQERQRSFFTQLALGEPSVTSWFAAVSEDLTLGQRELHTTIGADREDFSRA